MSDQAEIKPQPRDNDILTVLAPMPQDADRRVRLKVKSTIPLGHRSC